MTDNKSRFLKMTLVLVLILTGCHSTGHIPSEIIIEDKQELKEKKKIKKQKEQLNAYCKKKTEDVNRKAICFVYENQKQHDKEIKNRNYLTKERHSHGGIWVAIIAPYVLALIFTIINGIAS